MTEYICKHCRNIQYVSKRMFEYAHRVLCRVCSNEINPQDTQEKKDV
jgi:ribosomal protein S27E